MLILVVSASRLKSALVRAFPLKPNALTQVLLQRCFRHLLRTLDVRTHHRLVFTFFMMRGDMLVSDLNGAAEFVVFTLELSLA